MRIDECALSVAASSCNADRRFSSCIIIRNYRSKSNAVCVDPWESSLADLDWRVFDEIKDVAVLAGKLHI